jgi:hypothetical protein
LLTLIAFCDILLGLGVHAGMLAAVPAPMAGLTRPESADLRRNSAAAGAAVALCWLEQWGRLPRRNRGGTVGSVGFGSVCLSAAAVSLSAAAAAVHPR